MKNDNLAVLETARTYIGTPYHHLGRLKGVGIDCLGLIICVCEELGLPYQDKSTYSRYATGLNLFSEFQNQCQPAERGEGKILIFATRNQPNHCGIEAVMDDQPSLIHAYGPGGENKSNRSTPSHVVEHILGDWWEKKIVGVFDFPKCTNIIEENSTDDILRD
jgi:cell wall-associated NlpC family hydrolase